MSRGAQDAKIKQMINFIESEAQEKANEIKVQANEEFAIEKQNLVEAAKKKIREEYEKKEKQVEVEKKIGYSNKIKDARLTILKMKDDIMRQLQARGLQEVKRITEDRAAYSKLLKDLILQGLIRLLEKEANVYCRQQDLALVSEQAKLAEKEYAEKTGLKCKITVQQKSHLPADSFGGVVITAFEDRIKVFNTLEQRMALVYEQQLPLIRGMLFPKEGSTQL